MKYSRGLVLCLVLIVGFGDSSSFAGPDNQAYQNGLQALRSGDHIKAVELFTEAIGSSPADPRFYNDRGVAYKRAGNIDAAISDYSRAIELKPSYTHAFNNRGLLYLEQGMYEKAVADFTEALRHGELQSKIYTNMGLVKARQGDHKGAIKDYDKAFTYQPMDHRSFLFMAESLEKTGDLEKALRTYQLARGVVNDAQALSLIEGRINQLEMQTNSVKTTLPTGFERMVTPAQPARNDTSRFERGFEKPKPQLRDIARAQPRQELTPPSRRPEAPEEVKVVIDSLESLEESTGEKAKAKYTVAAREIYGQGREFLSKSDTTKALIRFEDARQLEKRARNSFTIAWSDVQIARVYMKLGDYIRAESYLSSALKLFDSGKADDQVVLALVELANTNRHLGNKEKAASFFTKAREKASSLGHAHLVKAISDLEAGKPTVSPKKTASVEQSQKREPAPPKTSAPASLSVPTAKPAGSKAVAAAPGQTAADTKRHQNPMAILRSYEGKKPAAVETPVGPKQHSAALPSGISHKPSVFRDDASLSPGRTGAPGPISAAGNPPQVAKASAVPTAGTEKPAAKEPTIKEDLALLKELKRKSDELQMIAVLERLGKRYFEMGDFQRSVHGLSAAISLREKLALTSDLWQLSALRAASRENLGAHAEALEDLARAAYLLRGAGGHPDNSMKDRFRRLTKSLGIDGDKIFDAFIVLWDSRKKGDTQGEAKALLMVGEVYDKAGRFPEALKYYERSSALMLANRAEVFGKMGKDKLAEEHYAQALDALRNLDYSGYIHIMKRSKIAGAPVH